MSIPSIYLDEIVSAFEKWFAFSTHAKIEDYYANVLTFEKISNLSQKDFEELFFEFAKEGGKIQTGGARTAGKFIENVHKNFTEFKQKILEPFHDNFNITEWITWKESFKYFGKGLSTIYLNRVDKKKFVIVNNKSIEAYQKLGYKVTGHPLERTYSDLFNAQTDIIAKYPILSNFFKTDALSEFLIGQGEGRKLLEKIISLNNKIQTISRESVASAIKSIDNNPELRKHRKSIEYDLVFNDKKYPPILVLSEANKISGGTELLLSDFGNSTKNAFSILESLGYKIERKVIDFYSQLQKFLTQSENGGLKTSEYYNNFEGLIVKVGFGKGNEARIPWIAFLDDKNTVQKGIYPVYLYYKRLNLLILAYGVSETKTPVSKWNLENPKSIYSYFEENGLGKPERYGSSFVFKTYDTNQSLNQYEINNDLLNILGLYTHHMPSPIGESKFEYRSFIEAMEKANLLLDKDLILRFISALLTKPFVILTGLSGSGKTKLAQSFAKWICESKTQVCLVPVGADWTNREPLLGFPSALEKGRYIQPDNGVLSLIMEASRENNQNKPYFLILDEMNLSHVERYFADFLSALESNELIPLHPNTPEWSIIGEVPASVPIPKNLFIIGTVNIDETTYMFSPKVLDRASVVEFRVSQYEMNQYLAKAGQLDLEKLQKLGSGMAGNFLSISRDKTIKPFRSDEMTNALLKFFEELKKIGAEFGYRSASEIMRFSAIVNQIDPTWDGNKILDIAVMQKLLPKVHGSRRKLEPVLKTLASLCIKEGLIIGKDLKIENLLNIEDQSLEGKDIIYPVSFEKIKRMYRSLIDNGFTSYAEA